LIHTGVKPKVVIMISGEGSNMRALVAALASMSTEIVAVLSNRQNAPGLAWAKAQGLNCLTVEHQSFGSRDAFDDELLSVVSSLNADFVLLAGFMRVLRSDFVRYFSGRLINIHPSLLPAFPGLNTHQRALDAGVLLHGATVHQVTEELDCGAILMQGALRVLPTDTAMTLAARVKDIEHEIYPLALQNLLAAQISEPTPWRLHSL
jgi:phosphoribosylglycinamide formyltransferase 1